MNIREFKKISKPQTDVATAQGRRPAMYLFKPLMDIVQ